ncbi:MAG: ATP-binding protein [Gammaproteobacteria bacterium]|nr:ATP-binding protein [Gammaproteobacteria bacterium]
MLIGFSVENFKSIKGEALLSLRATPAKEHRGTHLSEPPLTGQLCPLLHSAAIYGANAAGKTNFIEALKLMRTFVLRSGTEPGAAHTTPFLFAPDSKTRPTVLEVACIIDGVRYQYGFSLRQSTVVDEWLYAWPNGRVQTWFLREGDTWKLGGKLQGDKDVWRRATRPDALFLSTATMLNSEQLKSVHDWFAATLQVLGADASNCASSLAFCRKNGTAGLLHFLTAAGLRISDLRVTEENLVQDMLPADMPPTIREQVAREFEREKISRVWLKHDAGRGESTELELREESDGTRKIFALAAPWLNALKNGHVLVVDELHEHLHPKLVKFLVDLFHDPRINAHGAQLVFSTHDTSILDQDILRRDQIWLCECGQRQETRLFPLTDFRPRKGVDNLERAYLTGRYGALPRVQPLGVASGI